MYINQQQQAILNLPKVINITTIITTHWPYYQYAKKHIYHDIKSHISINAFILETLNHIIMPLHIDQQSWHSIEYINQHVINQSNIHQS